jgi:class 3 adenylate cyclase
MSSNKLSTDKDALAYLAEAAESGRPIEEVEKDLWNIYGCKRAVLAMDSSGFSRISESHGVAYFLSALMKARKVIETALKGFHCLHYRFEVDNLHADFESPTEALRAALSINEALKTAQIPLTDKEYL